MRCSDKSMSGLGKEERSSSSIDGDDVKIHDQSRWFWGKEESLPRVFSHRVSRRAESISDAQY